MQVNALATNVMSANSSGCMFVVGTVFSCSSFMITFVFKVTFMYIFIAMQSSVKGMAFQVVIYV